MLVPYTAGARVMDWKTTAWSRVALEVERARFAKQIAAVGPAAEIRIENRPFEGLKLLQPLLTGQDFPGSAAVYLFLQHNAPEPAPHVKFIEKDAALVADLRGRPDTKIAELLLTPEEAAQRPAEE